MTAHRAGAMAWLDGRWIWAPRRTSGPRERDPGLRA